MKVEKAKARSGGNDLYVFRFRTESEKIWYFEKLRKCAAFMDSYKAVCEDLCTDGLQGIIDKLDIRTSGRYGTDEYPLSGFLFAEELASFALECSWLLLCHDGFLDVAEECLAKFHSVCDDWEKELPEKCEDCTGCRKLFKKLREADFDCKLLLNSH